MRLPWLDRMTRQLERLERHGRISSEALALFVRFWLTSTPPLPDAAQATAQAKGTFTIDLCEPNCAAGKAASFPVTVKASDPRNCKGGLRVYNKVTLKFKGKSPKTEGELNRWTLGYGEHEKKKAVRFAAATQDVVAAATHDPRPAATQDPEPPPALSADAEWCGPGR